jgi:hypothetical protein
MRKLASPLDHQDKLQSHHNECPVPDSLVLREPHVCVLKIDSKEGSLAH